MFDLEKMKSKLMNQLCCLKEIVVLPSTKLFAGLETSRNFHEYAGTNRNSCKMYPLSAFYKLFSCQQMLRKTFCQGREDDTNRIMIFYVHTFFRTTLQGEGYI